MSRNLNAFGVADCESEVRQLKERYRELFFGEVQFCKDASMEETYLIVGRRGAGKTALSHYFGFSDPGKPVHLIDVDEPQAFSSVLSDVSISGSDDRHVAISRLVKVWSHVVWCIIFRSLADESERLAEICNRFELPGKKNFLENLLKKVLVFLGSGTGDEHDQRLDALTELAEGEAKALVLEYAKSKPIVVAIDTLEQYDISKSALMNALAALVQFGADFNGGHRECGVHLKIFMAGEVFPYLQEEVILNTLKAVKNPVHLVWRPRDLLRLICWRFHCNLHPRDLLHDESKKSIDWDNPKSVLNRMWIPYFGASIKNGKGYPENSFSYILRHTQMRPRQLITICNEVARGARDFPYFSSEDVVRGVAVAESILATEIINSYSGMYPRVGNIVTALAGMPMIFDGNELDRRAKESATHWPSRSVGDKWEATGYSPAAFRKLMAEIGVVGRVTREGGHNGFVDSEFEYSLFDRLPLSHRDRCVIHPMFYRKLKIDTSNHVRIMPFSTVRERAEAEGDF